MVGQVAERRVDESECFAKDKAEGEPGPVLSMEYGSILTLYSSTH